MSLPRVGPHLTRFLPFILTHPSHACLACRLRLHERSFRYIVCFTLLSCSFSHILILSLSFSLYHAYIISLHCIVSRQLHMFVTYVMCALCPHVCLLFVKTLFTFISFFIHCYLQFFLLIMVFPVFFFCNLWSLV